MRIFVAEIVINSEKSCNLQPFLSKAAPKYGILSRAQLPEYIKERCSSG